MASNGSLRERRRPRLRKERRDKIAQRVCQMYDADQRQRQEDRDRRLQRYAKFRQWTSGRSEIPWPDSSDVPQHDITTSVLRTEDTLHNAVMSNRPVVVARAMTRDDEPKQDGIDDLQDHQFFTEQGGEVTVGELADTFTKDGGFTAFVPWVREYREIRESKFFKPIPNDREPEDYFLAMMRRTYPDHVFRDLEGASATRGWDWRVIPDDEDQDEFEIHFYTTPEGEVEMVADRRVETFDGPKVHVLSYEDCVAPPRCANLQMPSQSNPNGAPHVNVRMLSTIEEILRDKRDGIYELLTDDEIGRITGREVEGKKKPGIASQRRDTSDESEEKQKDTIRGQSEDREEKDPLHEKLTILVCFDIYDFDGDGKPEDMVWWVLYERGLLLRARRLTEAYPSNPPRRPFAEAQFLPVKGRRDGIGLIELLEPLSDWQKVVSDMMMDSGALTNTPFFFYRPSSGLNPETIRPWPGDGIPVSDPANDVNFPNFSNATQTWAINLLSLLVQAHERMDLVGDLQLGRVPAGKASALRTIGGIQTILSQSEARPERILRRFFKGLTEIFQQMHELNMRYLRPEKEFRIRGYVAEGESPYRQIEDVGEIRGSFRFDFDANVLNSSKAALQESLESLAPLFVNELTVSLGIVKPQGIYKLLRDIGQARGQIPDKYLSAPSPDLMLNPLTAEEAITAIMHGAKTFNWSPLEGPEVHYEKLLEFVNSDELGAIPESQVATLRTYIEQTAKLRQAALQKQQVAAAAQRFGGAPQPGGNGASPPVNQGAPPVSDNEVIDETLPSAGGGAGPA